MQKLFRSLIAVGVAFGLAACGDDVSVTPPPAPDLVVTGAPTTAVQVGAKVQLSANQAVTWASSATNVATVDASGLVTAVAAGTASITATSSADASKKASVTITVTAPAVRSVTVNPPAAILAPAQTLQLVANVDADPGVARTVTWSSSNQAVATVSAAGVVTAVAPGTASITATSTAATSVAGSMALTVRAPTPAAISIQSVTQFATTLPVNFNNVFGQIDVTLNVDPGDQIISKVDILLDGTAVYTQQFSAAESQEMSLAAVSEAVSNIVGSIYTNKFDANTGVVSYPNGIKKLSARATIQGGTSVATPSLDLLFNNPSGWVASMSNTGTNTGFPAAAVNTTTGQGWTQGTHTLKLIAVNYQPGVTYSNVNVTMFGVNTTLVPTTGNVFNANFVATSLWDGTNLRLGNYLSNAAGELPFIVGSTLSNGQPGATLQLNDPANAANFGLQPMPLVRVDNTAPGTGSANGNAQTAAVVGVMPIWVNASYAYLPNAVFTAGQDIGAGSVTKKFWYIAGALPGTANSCTFTGMTAITTGSELAATTVSTVYSTRAQNTDALGNTRCYDVTGTNGADFIAPTIVSLTGPANNSASNALLGNFSFTVTDNASGFGANPVALTLSRLNASGTTSCLLGTSSCTVPAAQPLLFDATNGTNVDGYYTASNWSVMDQALNPTAVATRLYLYDATAPTFSGGISLQPLYTGNATAGFNTAVADNMDLASVFGMLTYPTGGFQYAPQSIGAYGAPLEQSANVTFNVAGFMRCLNVAGDFATTTNKPTQVDLTVLDQASNATPFAGGMAIPGANVENCGAVGATTINTFTSPAAVTYPTGKTQVDIDGASVATASGTTATLSAVADVPINTSVDPFVRVDFYWNDGTRWRPIGSSTGVLAQTPTTRTYTYSFVWDPTAPVTNAVTQVVAIGVDANGDAVFSTIQTIVLVP